MRQKLLLCITLIILSLILYYPTISVGFLSDDWGYVYLADRTNFTESISFFWSPDRWGNGLGNYRPIQSIMTVLMWNLHPKYIHLFTIILHGIISFLVGRLALALFEKKDISIISSLIFLFFPLNVEAVAWLASWNVLLAGIPLLLALILYTKKPPEKIKDYSVLCGLLFLSLLTKEHALVFPAFIVGIDLLKNRKVSYKNILISIGVVILYFGIRTNVLGSIGGYTTPESGSTHFDFSLWNLSLYLKLPLVYVYNFFNSAVVPKTLTIILRVASLILFFFILKKAFYKTNRTDKLKKIIILGALLYAGHAIGWNLFNPLDIHNQHSRLLYISTIWFAVFCGVTFSWLRSSRLKYIFYTYLICLPLLTLFQITPWVIAGMESQKIVNQIKNEAIETDNTLTIENLPDQYKGAFIFRNGIEFVIAMETNTEKNSIPVSKEMQGSVDNEVVIKIE